MLSLPKNNTLIFSYRFRGYLILKDLSQQLSLYTKYFRAVFASHVVLKAAAKVNPVNFVNKGRSKTSVIVLITAVVKFNELLLHTLQ